MSLEQIHELLKNIWEMWKTFSGIITIFILLYYKSPKRFERIIRHILWMFSILNRRIEKYAISREVTYITRSRFKDSFPWVKEIPDIKIEWGKEERVMIKFTEKKRELIIILKPGMRMRLDNIAMALIKAIPYFLEPYMESVYDKRILTLVAAHIARSLVKDMPSIVNAINEYISHITGEDTILRELAEKLVIADDRSLFTRVLLPEMIDVARERYPHRDPAIDQEVIELIRTLSMLTEGSELEKTNGSLCGK